MTKFQVQPMSAMVPSINVDPVSKGMMARMTSRKRRKSKAKRISVAIALERYPGAPELEETLALMIEAYEALGMADLAADTRRVLEENFGDIG